MRGNGTLKTKQGTQNVVYRVKLDEQPTIRQTNWVKQAVKWVVDL